MFSLTKPIRFAKQDTDKEIYDLLFYLGYFDEMISDRSEAESDRLWDEMKCTMSGEIGQDAIAAYQRFCGLDVDGDYGPKTKDALKHRFCSVPDVRFHPSQVRAAANRPRWPQDRITFHIVNDSGVNVPFAIVQSAIDHTCKSWNAVCGTLMETWQDGEPGPNIYGYFRKIDGNSGTLAWSMLAYAGMSSAAQLEQRYDHEQWYYNNTGQSQSGINLAAVMAHEVGHALGMDHISANFAKALLNPFYDPKIVVPQKADIDVVRQYYGPPKPTTPTEPDDPPTGSDKIKIVVNFTEATTIQAGQKLIVTSKDYQIR